MPKQTTRRFLAAFVDGFRSVVKGFDITDVLSLVGLALVGIGIWQLSQPIALIVVGALILWYALPARPPFIQR